MPFTTQESRNITDTIGPQVVGDRCFLAYRKMVRKWDASRRWTTAHEIYRDDVILPRLQDSVRDYMHCRTIDETAAVELAWQVFFIEKIMPYELEKKALNGDVQ